MKELLKKLRWKWHRDLTEGSLQEISAKLGKLEGLCSEVKNLAAINVDNVEKPGEANSLPIQNLTQKNELSDLFKVFSLLEDWESQKLLLARAYISLTQPRNLVPLFQYLMECERRGKPKDLISLLREQKRGAGKKLVVFGTSSFAKEIIDVCLALDIRIDYICREDHAGAYLLPGIPPVLPDDQYLDIPIISERELLSHHADSEVLVMELFCAYAQQDLEKRGFPKGHCWWRHTQWERQYLDPEIMKPHRHEVYVDGGVLDLQNTVEFIEWCGGEYDAVYAFEPDRENYQHCKERLEREAILDKARVHLFHAALWNRDEVLNFVDGDSGSSRISESGSAGVQARSIDSVLQGRPVTFVKLDIEGAEMNALRGAAQSIQKWKPRLAICIYHKPEDITEIPLYIHSLVPEYKMYIRHYSTCEAETVLYCVCE